MNLMRQRKWALFLILLLFCLFLLYHQNIKYLSHIKQNATDGKRQAYGWILNTGKLNKLTLWSQLKHEQMWEYYLFRNSLPVSIFPTAHEVWRQLSCVLLITLSTLWGTSTSVLLLFLTATRTFCCTCPT